ncbi:MAG: transcription termination factor Rho [Thermodesulfovibrionia bacterium]|nr:transcription termination factor Rho [Thermodesulfovibrionia bacterium]
MSSYGSNSRRGQSRPQQRSNVPARRAVSPDEKKFLDGTAVNPHSRIILEKGSDDISVRALDLICPIGMGQRALIVSSPGSGKTTFLKNICNAVTNGYPDMKVYCVLVDERPEEVTDFTRSVTAKVYSSSMDNSNESHIKVVDKVIAEAFKEAAAGHDVMILLDSLTRLARVHNTQHRGGGRTMSGGVGAGALEVPRRIFGTARNVEGMGSITIIATILVDTGSAMDTVIFEEFKGTGNMELVLSKELAQKRVFPAIDVPKSGTRRAELLFEPEEYKRLTLLHRGMASMNNITAMEKLIEMLQRFPSNSELLESFKVA